MLGGTQNAGARTPQLSPKPHIARTKAPATISGGIRVEIAPLGAYSPTRTARVGSWSGACGKTD
jgi:hypothetical protein